MGRLAEPRVDGDRLSFLDRRHDAGPERLPELVDFGRDIELVAEDRLRLLDVAVLDHDVQLVGLDRGCLTPHDVGEAVRGFLHRHPHARRREILSAQLLPNLVQLVQRRGGLTRRRAPRHEPAQIVLHVGDRRPVLAALPDVRERRGRLGQGLGEAARVAAGDDDRAFLAERLADHFDQAFAGPQRRPGELFRLHELVDERMRDADQHERRIRFRLLELIGRHSDRQRDAGRLQPEARGEIDGALGPLPERAEDDVKTIRNAVVVRVAEQAVYAVEVGEAETLFHRGAWPRRDGPWRWRRRLARHVD